MCFSWTPVHPKSKSKHHQGADWCQVWQDMSYVHWHGVCHQVHIITASDPQNQPCREAGRFNNTYGICMPRYFQLVMKAIKHWMIFLKNLLGEAQSCYRITVSSITWSDQAACPILCISNAHTRSFYLRFNIIFAWHLSCCFVPRMGLLAQQTPPQTSDVDRKCELISSVRLACIKK